jgi:hypothetical protein
MSIAILILSIAAILMSSVNIALWAVERKQSDRRHCAMLDYTDSKCGSVITATETEAAELREEMQEFRHTVSVHGERIGKLESGICPDYEKAMAAADAVNDFNAGISAIMTFDPIATARARRLGAADKEAE